MSTGERITVTEAAARIGKRPETLRRWIAAGKIDAIRDGAHVFIPATALDALNRTCEQCGKTYTPNRPTRQSRFCSSACRWAATYERRKTEHPATRGPGRPPKRPKPGKLDLSNKRLAAALKRTRRKNA